MKSFKANLEIIGINPFVFVPDKILKTILKEAGKEKGHIPVRGTVNESPFTQTLVRYAGSWRLYVNAKMLKNSPKRIGEILTLSIEFDPADRTISPHPKLVKALQQNKKAQKAFESLPPSRKREIIRYISSLKTEQSISKNIDRAIAFLTGSDTFIGRNNS